MDIYNEQFWLFLAFINKQAMTRKYIYMHPLCSGLAKFWGGDWSAHGKAAVHRPKF